MFEHSEGKGIKLEIYRPENITLYDVIEIFKEELFRTTIQRIEHIDTDGKLEIQPCTSFVKMIIPGEYTPGTTIEFSKVSLMAIAQESIVSQFQWPITIVKIYLSDIHRECKKLQMYKPIDQVIADRNKEKFLSDQGKNNVD